MNHPERFQTRIDAYLMRLRRERALTIIVTTHYIEEVEGCDRVCIIDCGHVLAVDTPAALKTAHGQELIRVIPEDTATADSILAKLQRLCKLINGTPH